MDNDRQLLSRLTAACLIALLAINPVPGLAQPSGDKLALKLRNNVVKIIAKRESGESNQGFGFIVGKQHGKFYIVTANHVVRSNRPGGASTSVKVKFYSDPGHSYKADLLETFYGKPQDFAVIQVAVPPNFSWQSKALVPPESIKGGLRGEDVWFIGRSGQWYIPAIPGRINSERPDLHSIIHVDMVSVRVGTSGAPLITKNGIIGMIIQDEVGSARAVSIGAIQAAFDEWRYPWSLQVFLDEIAQPKSQPTVSMPSPPAETATIAKPPPESSVREAKSSEQTTDSRYQAVPKPSPPAGTGTVAKLPPESPVGKAEPPEQTTDLRYQVGVLPLQLRNDASRFKFIFTELIEESIKETQFFSEYHYYKMNTKYKTDRSEIIFNKKLMESLWVKKGFFSKPEPNTDFIMQLGKQLEVDAILLFSANVMNMAKDRIRAILVDVKREKIYSSSGITDFVLTEDTDQTLEARFDAKRITKKVFAEFKSSY
jgi:hypothetical protein